ncbi:MULTISPECIES: DUF5980 family protein [Streptomyces]|uniref:DUF5980 family protein n=1 Tax=Streptomyces TaxID=1883 RepID=UPI0003A7D6D4|nr:MULTISPECIES: DUF5980 family protein [Streptomyces]ALK02240.1 zinc metalloprotease [Streptomyces sp. FXJ7.023]MBZ6113583.1 hypothetical protein [Streptomyces olivaceus]MBZ6127356.1 hypothetical protein [Streptomyces olivaceus]MBZ6148108.1 hypothetical protein [Streptomyces olivaceus]MBZ6161599.1 hypothetical protein [Streptomyces olivaceus]
MPVETVLRDVPAALGSVIRTQADTWTLHGNNQYCVKPDRGWPRTYAVGAVEGTWSSTITAGLRKPPAGSTNDGTVTQTDVVTIKVSEEC